GVETNRVLTNPRERTDVDPTRGAAVAALGAEERQARAARGASAPRRGAGRIAGDGDLVAVDDDALGPRRQRQSARFPPRRQVERAGGGAFGGPGVRSVGAGAAGAQGERQRGARQTQSTRNDRPHGSISGR